MNPARLGGPEFQRGGMLEAWPVASPRSLWIFSAWDTWHRRPAPACRANANREPHTAHLGFATTRLCAELEHSTLIVRTLHIDATRMARRAAMLADGNLARPQEPL